MCICGQLGILSFKVHALDTRESSLSRQVIMNNADRAGRVLALTCMKLDRLPLAFLKPLAERLSRDFVLHTANGVPSGRPSVDEPDCERLR